MLLLGGAATFDGSWQGSRLEQLLPVDLRSRARRGRASTARSTCALTDGGAPPPVFQVKDGGSGEARLGRRCPPSRSTAACWRRSRRAAVWARHDEDRGPERAAHPDGVAGLRGGALGGRLRAEHVALAAGQGRATRRSSTASGGSSSASWARPSRQDVGISCSTRSCGRRPTSASVLERQPRPERAGGAAGAPATVTVTVSAARGGAAPGPEAAGPARRCARRPSYSGPRKRGSTRSR